MRNFNSIKIVSLSFIFIFSYDVLFAQTKYFPAGLDSTFFNTWLDATDASTVILTNNVISQWRDKSDKGMNAANANALQRPILTTLEGKRFVEFNGVKGLIIPEKSNFLDPPMGSFLIQSIYIYPDITIPLPDFRISTYSREGSRQFGYRIYGGSKTLSEKLLLSVMHNSQSDPPNKRYCGYDDAQMKDLKGSFSIVENNSYYKGSFNGGQLNVDGLSGLTFSYPTPLNATSNGYVDINQNAGIGNRPSNQAAVHWAIGEHIFLNKTANESEKILLRSYMTLRWSNLVLLSPVVKNIINDIPISHYSNLIGLYKAAPFDSVALVKSNSGIIFSSLISDVNTILPNEKNIFLKDKGDYLIATDNGNNLTNVGIGQFLRLHKSWFIVKKDSASNGGFLKISFDANKLGLISIIGTKKFYIAFNELDVSFLTGKNKIIPVQGSVVNSGLIQFIVDSRYIEKGYYSLMFGDPNTFINTTTLPNYEVFAPLQAVILKPPFFEKTIIGGSYIKLSWNTSKLSYQPLGFFVYQSISGTNNFTLISTVYNRNSLIIKGLLQNQSYSYKIKAFDIGLIESGFSNEEIVILNSYSTQWRIKPQYSGVGKITMSGDIPLDAEEYEFQFDRNNTLGSWQSKNYRVDSNLTSNTSYSYRFRHRLKNDISTTSNWSSTQVANTGLDSLQGGFTYQWVRFNDTDTSLYGLGYHKVMYDTTGLRYITHIAPYGQHPRIYCNPEDRLSIKSRLLKTESGKAILKQFRAVTKLLNTGTITTLDNDDGLGGVIVSNLGSLRNNVLYKSFINDELAPMQSFFATGSYLFLHQLALEAFESWCFIDENSPIPTTYSMRAANCAKVLYNWSKRVKANEIPKPKEELLYLSLAYDFSYPFMDEVQRNSVREVIAMNALDVSQLKYGFGSAYTQTSNWATFGYEVIPNLAIEGEVGYKPETTDVWAKTAHNFMNYGLYENGVPIEGLGKNQVNAVLLVALAKRGYSMLGIPNLKNYATDYLPAIIQPFGFSFYMIDLLGGTGADEIQGGKKFNILDIVGLKWVLPNDDKVDFAWKNYIGRKNARGKQGYGYAYAMGVPRVYFAPNIPAAIFCSNYFVKDNHVFKNFDFIDGLGGLVIFKNSLDTLGSQVYFHSRQDFGGHPYANRGTFSFSSLGRIWIPLITTNANSQSVHADSSQFHSCIIVDKLGGISKFFPTKIIQLESKANISKVANNMQEYYSYNYVQLAENKNLFSAKEFNPQLSTQPFIETSNDFRYQKSSYAHRDLSNQGSPNWLYPNTLDFAYKNRKRNVEKVFRTLSLMKSGNPYLLIVDDIKMDEFSHNYTWLAQLPRDLSISETIVNLNNTNYRNDIILSENSASGNRKLLIRILQGEGIVNPAKPGSINSTNVFKAPRLLVESQAVEPKFKIMIYAFSPTMPLPITNWNTQKDKLEVVWPDRIQNIDFPMDSNGKTDIILSKEIIKNQISIPIIPIR